MLVLFDHNNKFLAVGVGSYGKVDTGIFAKSPVRKNNSKAMKFPPLGPLPGAQRFTLRSFQADNCIDKTVSS